MDLSDIIDEDIIIETIKPKKESSLLYLLNEKNPQKIVDFISHNQERLNETDEFGKSSFHYICSNERIKETAEILKMLIDKKANPNLGDQYGKTGIHYLATNKNLKLQMLKEIYDSIDIELKDNKGKSILHYLSSNDSIKTEILQYCLRNGFNPRIKDNTGKTALHYFCKR